jgi:hypothetical protein
MVNEVADSESHFGVAHVKNANKYWRETAASKEFGIPSTTLRHAWERGDIETATTACGLTLLYGPSIRKYARKRQPNPRVSGVIQRRRTALRTRGAIHAVPASSMPEGRALCGVYSSWGPAIKGNRKESQITCGRCKERATGKKVS